MASLSNSSNYYLYALSYQTSLSRFILQAFISVNYHNGFSLDSNDHKNKWSRHRSFLYGCDRSPGMHILKLGTEIPNLKQHNWSTILIWKF